MASTSTEPAKKVAAILGALLLDSEEVHAVSEPAPEEAVAVLATVLCLVRKRSV
ncbi:MAG: hypothetical protein HY900_04685 [Deltaproteobacteria bacterium]|nr:hypothetical protein [Deltaproteobacteria bacterium]